MLWVVRLETSANSPNGRQAGLNFQRESRGSLTLAPARGMIKENLPGDPKETRNESARDQRDPTRKRARQLDPTPDPDPDPDPKLTLS